MVENFWTQAERLKRPTVKDFLESLEVCRLAKPAMMIHDVPVYLDESLPLGTMKLVTRLPRVE